MLMLKGGGDEGWEGGRVYQPSGEGNVIVFLGHQSQDPTKINQEVISNSISETIIF